MSGATGAAASAEPPAGAAPGAGSAPGSGPAVAVRGLTVRAGGRVLLEGAGLEVRERELCLLVGASGTGKTITLGLLAGLVGAKDGLEITGNVEVLGHDVLARRDGAGVPGTGIVFQDFALLDDVDAEGNVRFGLDHAAVPKPGRAAAARALLDEFGLPPRVLPARMSGGMKQRLALARVLAFDPRLVFYDEPTSGLDPARKRQVAARIREVHDRHRMTSLVVTHDLPSLLGIADRVILLDPERKVFREVPRDGVDAALDALSGYKPEDSGPPPPRPWLLRAPLEFLEGAGAFVLGAGRTLAALVPRYPSPAWGWRFFWRFLRLTTLGTALPFLALAGLISGFVTAFFMFSLLPVKEFTEPVLEEEFIGSLGFALYRVVIPGVASLLFASRAGAAIAADMGNRVLTRQVDALRSHGIPPERYLLTGVSLASLLGIPLLFATAYVLARFAATAVFLATHPGHGPVAFDAEFHRLLGTWGPFPGGTGYVLGKILLGALGSASIAAHVGLRPKPSGAAVAEGVTAAIIRATIYVLVIHMIFAFFEF